MPPFRDSFYCALLSCFILSANSAAFGMEKLTEAIDTTQYRPGYSQIVAFSTKLGAYLLFYRINEGKIFIYPVDEEGFLGEENIGQTPRINFTHIVPYYVNSEVYLLFYQQDSGRTAIYAINADGSLGEQLKYTTYRSGYSEIGPIYTDEDCFLFFYHGERGRLSNYLVTRRGLIGGEVFSIDIRPQCTAILSYETGEDTFMSFYKAHTGRFSSYRVTPAGNLGQEIIAADYSKGYKKIFSYVLDDATYLMFYHAAGDASGYKVAESGRPIDDIYHQLFLNDATSLVPIVTEGSLFVLGYSSSTGNAALFELFEPPEEKTSKRAATRKIQKRNMKDSNPEFKPESEETDPSFLYLLPVLLGAFLLWYFLRKHGCREKK